MKTTVLTALALAMGLMISMASAEIVSVSLGPVSIPWSTPPAIIPPPPAVLNSFVFNTGQQGFNEAKVVTTIPHPTDSGAIPSDVLVSSHMIFLNAEDGTGGITHTGVIWTFSQPILGVMSDSGGTLEAASTFELGAPGTNYTVGPPAQVAPYSARGMEGGDSYQVLGNQIRVNMYVAQPGDWIRVVTCAQGSQGFWKNYPGDWLLPPGDPPVIVIGGEEYTQKEAIEIMKMPIKGDKTLTMFPQLVAAKLNVLTAACPIDCIEPVIDAADAWMETYGPAGSGVKANSDAWKEGEPLYLRLDAYNNEELTCPEGD